MIPIEIEGSLNHPGQQRHTAATLVSALVGELRLESLDKLIRFLEGKDDHDSENTLEEMERIH